MTHFIADGDSAARFSTKKGALDFLRRGKRVRASTGSPSSRDGQDWSPPRGSTDELHASQGQSSVEVRA